MTKKSRKAKMLLIEVDESCGIDYLINSKLPRWKVRNILIKMRKKETVLWNDSVEGEFNDIEKNRLFIDYNTITMKEIRGM